MSLWRAATHGEELFLLLYDQVGRRLTIDGGAEVGLDFLVDPAGFRSFSRLVATSEVFVRCVRLAADTSRLQPNATPREFAIQARHDLDLPASMLKSPGFGELLKQVGNVVLHEKREPDYLRRFTKDDGSRCYMCGVTFIDKHERHAQSTEHIWPVSLGGQSIGENLIPACVDCNSKRGNMATWVNGPVHVIHAVAKGKNPEESLRLSLALARILRAASPTEGRTSALTLKAAAKQLTKADPVLKFEPGRPYVYFEFLRQVETME